MFPTYSVIFFVFAAVLIIAALMVIFSRNPVRAVLFLVVSFFAAAVLWMLLQAEFLSLVLIFVYVGAVMTLFLFVVMMLNIDLARMRERFMKALPIGLVVMIVLVALMVLVVTPKHWSSANIYLHHFPADYSNTKEMGSLLYTHYLYPFEIAGALLLVAIVGAISLAFYGRKKSTKTQVIDKQHAARKQDRLRIVDMKAEKK